MDALDDVRSRSGYAPTTPLMSEHEDSDLLVPVPQLFECSGIPS